MIYEARTGLDLPQSRAGLAANRMGRFNGKTDKGMKIMSSDSDWPPLPPLQTGLRGRCPRCGQGHLFNGFLSLRPSCEVCGLDYSFADPADGPAFFVICFACIPSVALGVWLEVAFNAPLWVHLITTLPFMLLTCIPPLRPLKGWLVSSQYFYKAEEGKLVRREAQSPKPGTSLDPRSAGGQ